MRLKCELNEGKQMQLLNAAGNMWRWICCCIIRTSRVLRPTTRPCFSTSRITSFLSNLYQPTTQALHPTLQTWPTTKPSALRCGISTDNTATIVILGYW